MLNKGLARKWHRSHRQLVLYIFFLFLCCFCFIFVFSNIHNGLDSSQVTMQNALETSKGYVHSMFDIGRGYLDTARGKSIVLLHLY